MNWAYMPHDNPFQSLNYSLLLSILRIIDSLYAPLDQLVSLSSI